MEDVEEYFSVLLFSEINEMVLTSESVDNVPDCEHKMKAVEFVHCCREVSLGCTQCMLLVTLSRGIF